MFSGESIAMDDDCVRLAQKKQVDFSPLLATSGGRPLSRRLQQAVQTGVGAALRRGPLVAYATLGVGARLHSLQVGSRATSTAMVAACVAEAIAAAMLNANPVLLEPIMKLEVTSRVCVLGAGAYA